MPRVPHDMNETLTKLRDLSVPENRAGMAKFGIEIERAMGISMPNIRDVAKEITKDHDLAQKLWDSKYHEARILACLVDHPKWVTSAQMENWVADFNSWDLCDQVCGNLFDKTEFVDEKIYVWAEREEEFVRRAAFALIAWRAVHDKKTDDSEFTPYFELIEAYSNDPRNFVKKAVNWALRQIGKRSAKLHKPALALAFKLKESSDSTKIWIGKDAYNELDGTVIRERLGL